MASDGPERRTYRPLFQALEPGMIVAFNRSCPGETGTQELEVESVSSGGTVILKRGHDDRLAAKYTEENGMVFYEIDDEGFQLPGGSTGVVTLEVIGLA